jgi:hypothetical protein
MPGDMLDSRLNGAERPLQQSFRKIFSFNGLLMIAAVVAAYWLMHDLPGRSARPPAVVPLRYEPVSLPVSHGPLALAGAWIMTAGDPRFGGLSALAIDRGRFLTVSDRGAVIRFDPPSASYPQATLQDLTLGPGRFGKKWSRDAESLSRDSLGRGWWVGYERRHSLWLYDAGFSRVLAAIDLPGLGWRSNRGAEGLLAGDGTLLVLAENGRHAIRIEPDKTQVVNLHAGAEVADAAMAPDGSAWILLREKGLGGIGQSVAPLLPSPDGYIIGPKALVPKGALDNFEGMTIAALPNGQWRFWLVTDDGHRVMARTLLVALDLKPPVNKDKGPAAITGPSKRSKP